MEIPTEKTSDGTPLPVSTQPCNVKESATTTVQHFFSTFHEDFNPEKNVSFHTRMCILDYRFNSILHEDAQNIQQMFPKVPIESIFQEISALFATLYVQDEWEVSYTSMLKFLEEKEYSLLPELKLELEDADDIVDELADDMQDAAVDSTDSEESESSEDSESSWEEGGLKDEMSD